jgi:hypothetical protein
LYRTYGTFVRGERGADVKLLGSSVIAGGGAKLGPGARKSKWLACTLSIVPCAFPEKVCTGA